MVVPHKLGLAAGDKALGDQMYGKKDVGLPEVSFPKGTSHFDSAGVKGWNHQPVIDRSDLSVTSADEPIRDATGCPTCRDKNGAATGPAGPNTADVPEVAISAKALVGNITAINVFSDDNKRRRDKIWRPPLQPRRHARRGVTGRRELVEVRLRRRERRRGHGVADVAVEAEDGRHWLRSSLRC